MSGRSGGNNGRGGGPTLASATTTTPTTPSSTGCIGSDPSFDPEARAHDQEAAEAAAAALERDDFKSAIEAWFRIPAGDNYVYHALTSVRLAEVQHAISMGAKNGLHAWYRGSEDQPLPPPPPQDVEAYTTIFDPTKSSAPSALRSFLSNAKKSSRRLEAATHLSGRRFVHPSLAKVLAVPKLKLKPKPKPKPPSNPYLPFWAWSCRNLEWCGPVPGTESLRMSHHVLPVLMHHFGCVAPSYEAVEVLRLLGKGRAVADVGSGNGYWSFVLRQHGVPTIAIDNAQSLWRTTWIADTVSADGVSWLRCNSGGKDLVLLLVYPVVGPDGTGAFTRSLLAAYEGDTLAVVGTQNRNGYTGFRDMTMDEYMNLVNEEIWENHRVGGASSSRDSNKEWVRVVQIPLPSFPGKDEALFVFQRGDSAPARIPGDVTP